MKTVLISGCYGFIGQNLVHKLSPSYNIIGVDNFSSSSRSNIKNFQNLKNFKFIEADIIELPKIDTKIDLIFNLACPASPPKYQLDPFFTMKTNFIGTLNLLELAKKNNSIFIQASTSEVYGDPEIHPQIETYNGNVNTIGKRSCYDEGKRIAETLCYEYRENYNIRTRILRIFNTYGPFMDMHDGRVISNFIVNTINRKPLVIYGNGSQTRSFCFIDDLVSGLIKAMDIEFTTPINLGNNNETSLNELAMLLINKFGKNKINFTDSVEDDPQVRNPDITSANKILNWSPIISLSDGLDLTYQYFKSKLNES